MKTHLRSGILAGLVLCVLFCGVRCRQQQPNSGTSPPSAASPSTGNRSEKQPSDSESSSKATPPASTDDRSSALPPGHPPIQPAQQPAAPATPPAGQPATVSPEGLLTLQGLTLKVPSGWVSQPVTPSNLGPVAVLHMTVSEDGAGKVEARITHYPSMHGMPPDQNIQRWLTQVTGADGKPIARDQAKVESLESQGVQITILDVAGKVSGGGPGMPGGIIENGRLIAAILEHPAGPHFIKITGTADAMEKCAGSTMELIRSASAGQ